MQFVDFPVIWAKMYPPVATNNPTAVEVEVQSVYLCLFPEGDRSVVSLAFDWAVECFAGRYGDYQAVDAPYHDLEHTLQGTLCLARLFLGRHRAGVSPPLTPRLFELGLLAILFHDSGYLKKRSDTSGTGAKYTVMHVERSARFAAEFLSGKGYSAPDIVTVQNMIHCTGVDAALQDIRFESELEREIGHILGTADLLGQLAADDYVSKLPALYAEFAEAARFTESRGHLAARYASAEELILKTPEFWEKFVQVKLDREFGGVYRFLSDPYPDGRNPYLEKIGENMERLRRLSASRPA
ncbi:MAG: hypothetical protein U1F98_12420 [Verrucomicrobiota bacterium]